MSHRAIHLLGTIVAIVAIALFVSPISIFAQLGGGSGGGGISIGAPSGGAIGSRPDGVSEADDLKTFHHVMAVQATPAQRAAFARVAQSAQDASDQLANFRKSLQSPGSTALSDQATTIDQAMEQARTGGHNFLSMLSSAQKSGLDDATKRLEKTDSQLDKDLRMFDQNVHVAKPEIESISNSAAALEKAFSSFQSEQLALAREMSILVPTPGQGVTFSLPQVTDSITVAGQSIDVPESGAVISHNSAASNQNLFALKLVADLSEVQQNISAILRVQFTSPPRCGERVQLLQATLTPLAPASLVVANLLIERWICPPGQQTPTHLADGAATIDIKLTPSVAPDGGLRLSSEITHVEADSFFRNMLRSGDLGVTLREQIAAALLPVMQKGADLKSALPPVAQQSATLQNAQFQDDGSDQMSLILDGQLQLSDDQTQQFAAELKQRLAAQQTAPR